MQHSPDCLTTHFPDTGLLLLLFIVSLAFDRTQPPVTGIFFLLFIVSLVFDSTQPPVTGVTRAWGTQQAATLPSQSGEEVGIHLQPSQQAAQPASDQYHGRVQ